MESKNGDLQPSCSKERDLTDVSAADNGERVAMLDQALNQTMSTLLDSGFVKTIGLQQTHFDLQDGLWIVAELAKDLVEQTKYRRTCVPAGTEVFLKANGMMGESLLLETVEECLDSLDPQYMEAPWAALHAAMKDRERDV